MKIALWTLNKAKAKWLQDAVGDLDFFADKDIQYSYHKVETGVADTPLSLSEAMDWASNRAKALYKDNQIQADYYIGQEGAVTKIGESGEAYLFGAVYIIDARGVWHGGCSPMMPIPSSVTQALYDEGRDLGELAREMTWDQDITHTSGSFGYFSDDLFTRDEQFRLASMMAFVPFWSDKYI